VFFFFLERLEIPIGLKKKELLLQDLDCEPKLHNILNAWYVPKFSPYAGIDNEYWIATQEVDLSRQKSYPCNVVIISRIVHYISLLFPLYQFYVPPVYDTDWINWATKWSRMRGLHLNSNFSEAYRAMIYEWSLNHGTPVQASIEVTNEE